MVKKERYTVTLDKEIVEQAKESYGTKLSSLINDLLIEWLENAANNNRPSKKSDKEREKELELEIAGLKKEVELERLQKESGGEEVEEESSDVLDEEVEDENDGTDFDNDLPSEAIDRKSIEDDLI